ncbi:MAG TPA: NUDIX domain-containing protein [Patescibacteria group bacterium]
MLNASHALLITKEGKILLQHKDDNAKILNPGRIAMFGGAVEGSENEMQALERELNEELELELSGHEFYKLNDYLKTIELDGVEHNIHVFVVKNVAKNFLVLHEGQAIIEDTAENFLNNPKITRITKLALNDFVSIKK